MIYFTVQIKTATAMLAIVGLGLLRLSYLPNSGLASALLVVAGLIAAGPLLLPDRLVSHISKRFSKGDPS